MRVSKYILPTLKEDPSDAVVTSHKLMMRAGLIRKESAGMYIYLPLGLKVLQKIMNIVREEMNRAGGMEFLMPELTNSELWKESGRWDVMGPEMMRVTDRNGAEYTLAPTHEEAFTAVVRTIISSYRDLPITVYQMNTKFRDEIRPRYGVIRSKEFIMKDAYSFDLDKKGLDESYETMRKTYRKIFERCSLKTIPVQADSGSMGGSASEEFMVASEVGEETLLLCDDCGYRANQEKAEYRRIKPDPEAAQEDLIKVDTPDVKTIDELTEFFKISEEQFLKSIIYLADEKPVMAVVPGDREINEHKLKNILKAIELELAPDSIVEEVTGAPVGYAGPINLSNTIEIIFDKGVKNISNGITGANIKDVHYKGVNPGRDFKIEKSGDITSAKAGDQCIKCGKPLYVKKGIEVGHIFKLGYKYTEAMKVDVLAENGKPVTPIMGCYGIGINRTMSAIIEQNYDKRGIIWPKEVAPFQVHLIGIGKKSDEIAKIDEIYNLLMDKGYDVIYDDRKVSPGFKFADADLIGIPIRLTVGKTFFQSGEIEFKERATGDTENVKVDDLIQFIDEKFNN